MKPRVFIGSSSEGLDVARAVETNLAEKCECDLWRHTFDVSDTFIESLEKELLKAEFAVLVVTPDDVRVKRDEASKVPRDNIIFELGLFMGKLGRERTFVVHAAHVELPTDLMGLSTAEYEERSDGNLEAAVSPAARKITREILKSKPLPSPELSTGPSDFLLDEDALFDAIVGWPTTPSQIIIQTSDTAWATNIIPTLIRWRMNDVPVHVFAPPVRQEGIIGWVQQKLVQRELAQRALLRGLGVDFREMEDIPFSAFALRTDYPGDDVVIVGNEGKAPLAVRYTGMAHARAVDALNKLLPDPPAPSAPSYSPCLERQEVAEVIDKLRRRVNQYKPTQVTMDLTTIRTSELLLMSPYARSYKLKQIENLVDAYSAIGQEPFVALAVTLQDEKTSILTPPVVEERPEGYVVIEGTTRAAYCYRNHLNDYHCILVRGVREDLPGKPIGIESVVKGERTLDESQRTEDYIPGVYEQLYRHIEWAVHPY